MGKKWKPFEHNECPSCGSDAEVFTTHDEPGFAYDGDQVRCEACGHPGTVSVEDDYEDDICARIMWHDESGCQCDWCRDHPPATGA